MEKEIPEEGALMHLPTFVAAHFTHPIRKVATLNNRFFSVDEIALYWEMPSRTFIV